MHFSGLFKNIVFRSVALVTKKLWTILDFFHRPDFFSVLWLYPTLSIKKIFVNKIYFKLFSLKVTKFYGDIIKNESTRTKTYRYRLFKVKM